MHIQNENVPIIEAVGASKLIRVVLKSLYEESILQGFAA